MTKKNAMYVMFGIAALIFAVLLPMGLERQTPYDECMDYCNSKNKIEYVDVWKDKLGITQKMVKTNDTATFQQCHNTCKELVEKQ